MARFNIVMVSEDDNFTMDVSYPSESNYRITPIPNNRENITKVYNKILDYTKENDKGCEFLIFMHADVKLDVPKLLNHIDECSGKYDVMGLCGCAKISVSQQPLNWFCGSRPYPESRWGCVTHGELDSQTSFFSSHSPNVTDHEVCCIDGLCIIFGRKAIDSDLRFDEYFQFNHYDTDISFSTVMTHKMKLGVLVERGLYHYSVGRSILEPSFLEEEKYFREKWKI